MRNVDFGEVSDTSDLYVFWGLDEMDTLQGSVRDSARATTGLGAVSDSLCFNVANGGKVSWSKNTSVDSYQEVELQGLTRAPNAKIAGGTSKKSH